MLDINGFIVGQVYADMSNLSDSKRIKNLAIFKAVLQYLLISALSLCTFYLTNYPSLHKSTSIEH